MEFTSQPGANPRVDASPRGGEPLGLYRRIAAHERGLWGSTIAVVVTSAATLALVTVTAGMHGVFNAPQHGYLLAGGIFLLLAVFIF